MPDNYGIGVQLEFDIAAVEAKVKEFDKIIDGMRTRTEEQTKLMDAAFRNMAQSGSGLDALINKVKEAKAAIEDLATEKTVTITANLSGMGTTAQATAMSLSDVIQAMSQLRTKDVDLLKFDVSAASAEDLRKRLVEIEKTIEELKKKRKDENGTVVSDQALTNQIRALEEYARVLRMSDAEKNKLLLDKGAVVQRREENKLLTEQNRLLNERAKLSKQINNLFVLSEKNSILDIEPLTKEQTNLYAALQNRMNQVNAALTQLAEKSQNVSTATKDMFDTRNSQDYITKVKQIADYHDKLNKERIKAEEIVKAQNKSALQPTSEELSVQRQLTSLYAEKLRYEKELKNIQMDTKIQGSATEAQKQYIQYLLTNIARLRAEIDNVGNGYKTIRTGVEEAYKQDRSDFMAKKNYELAESLRRVEEARKAAEAKAAATKQNVFTTYLQDTSALQTKLNEINQDIDRLKTSGAANIEALRAKMQEATSAAQEFASVFEVGGLKNEASGLKTSIANYENMRTAGTASYADLQTLDDMKKRYADIMAVIAEFDRLQNEATNATNKFNSAVSSQRGSLDFLQYSAQQVVEQIQGIEKVNASLNAEMAKGTTIKGLVNEYKNLVNEATRMKQLIESARSIGMDTSNNAAYDAVVAQYGQIYGRIRQIEAMNVDAINEYRAQKEAEANQKSVADYIVAVQEKSKAESAAREENYKKYVTSYEGVMRAAQKLESGRTSGDYANTYENRERVIKQLTTALSQLSDTEGRNKTKAESLRTTIQKLTEAQNQYKAALKGVQAAQGKQEVTVDTAIRAYSIAKQTGALKDLKIAYDQLKTAMSGLKYGSEDWFRLNGMLSTTKGKIDQIKTAMGEVGSKSKSTTNTLEQLKRGLLAAFSISAIRGYINKMVEVRAQFELQNVALRAILQNKDEADRIFLQVQNMALQSPFTIMQLTTYTKQLAAYRIEASKLVQTTKMLADVSAGLGVDMQRLILAYGQVKSANYLRATEVRQFTEAGLNIAGELATYFSELKGRVISVGDVMDMITKRMVKFEDVEEVFRRVTSEGGIFFDMQKKQSETLYGQVQRIKDAYNIMLNDIGKDNQSFVSQALQLIRMLINHWQPLASDLKAFLYTFGIGKLLNMWRLQILAIGGSLKKLGLFLAEATKKTSKFANSLANMSNVMQVGIGLGITSFIAGLSVLIHLLNVANDKATKVMQVMASADADVEGDANNGINTYERLAATIASVTTSFEERTKAMEEMKRTFNDILPSYMLEREWVSDLKENLPKATAALREYYDERRKQRELEALQSAKTKTIDELFTKNGMKNFDAIKDIWPRATLDKAKEIYTETISEGVKQGYKEGSDFAELFVNKMNEYYTSGIYSLLGGTKKQLKDIKAVTDDIFDTNWWGDDFKSVMNYTEAIKKLEEETGLSLKTNTEHERQTLLVLEKQKKEREETLNTVENLFDKLSKLQKSGKLSADGAFTKEGEEGFQQLNDLLTQMGAKPISNLEELNTLLGSNFRLQERIRNIKSDYWIQWADDIKKMTNAADPANALVEKFSQNIKGVGEAAKGTSIQRDIWAVMQKISEGSQLGIDSFVNFEVTAQDSFGTAAESAKKAGEAFEQQAKQYKQISESMVWADPEAQAQLITGLTKEQFEQAPVIIEFFKTLAKALGALDKNSGKGKDTVSELWKNRLKALQDYYKKYEETNKLYSDTESLEKSKEAFRKYFEELGLDIDEISKLGMGKEGAVLNLEKMIEEVRKIRPELVDEFEKVAADFRVEIGVKLQEDALEKVKKEMDELLDNVELTKELKNQNLPIDLIYMVGGKPIDLDGAKENIESFYKDLLVVQKKYGEEGVKAYNDIEKKIKETELKELKDRIKSYTKYLSHAYTERVKYQLDAYAEMKQMQDDLRKSIKDAWAKIDTGEVKGDDAEKLKQRISTWESILKQGVAGIKKEIVDKMAEFDFKQIMESPLFSEIFQDLGNLTSGVLDTMLEKIKDIRNNTQNLSLTQIKQLAQYEEKIRNAKFDSDAFKAPIEAIKEAYKLRTEGITATTASEDLASSEQQLANLEKELEDLQLIQGLKQGALNIDQKNLNLSERQKKYMEMTPDAINMEIAARTKNIETTKSQVSTNQQYVQTFSNARLATEKLQTQLQEVGKIGSGAIDVITSGLQLFGEDISESDAAWFDFAKNMIDQCVQLGIMFVALGIEINSALGIIGLIAEALTLVAGLFSTILKAHDAGVEKQIEKVKDKVEELQKAYEKLEKAIENAYSTEAYETDYTKAQNNIEKQIAAYKEMINLEYSKKQTDKDKIKEYQDAIDDLEEQLEDLRIARIQAMGGFGSGSDYQQAAEDFVSAWLDAFKETGEGLDALDDKWQEFVENLFVKQAAYKKAGKLYEGIFSMIDDALDKGISGAGLEETLKAAQAQVDSANEQLDEYLKALAQVFNISPDSESTLSDLQKGIQNITEAQAAALEAYVNSIRFYVAEQNTILRDLSAAIREQYSSSDNPVLSVIKEIRDAVNNLSQRFFSVTEVKSGRGYILKVG
jgi:DNA repair exonuclease SbcCD ATPase subunit